MHAGHPSYLDLSLASTTLAYDRHKIPPFDKTLIGYLTSYVKVLMKRQWKNPLTVPIWVFPICTGSNCDKTALWNFMKNFTQHSWGHVWGVYKIKPSELFSSMFFLTLKNHIFLCWSVFFYLWPNCWIKNYKKNTEHSSYKSSCTYQKKSWANCYLL